MKTGNPRPHIYTDIARVGRTSITLTVEAWAQRSRYDKLEKVTAGTFIMVAMDDEHPGYDFAVHKGYSTAHHMSRIDTAGPSPQHRMSYRNVAARVLVGPASDEDRLTG